MQFFNFIFIILMIAIVSFTIITGIIEVADSVQKYIKRSIKKQLEQEAFIAKEKRKQTIIKLNQRNRTTDNPNANNLAKEVHHNDTGRSNRRLLADRDLNYSNFNKRDKRKAKDIEEKRKNIPIYSSNSHIEDQSVNKDNQDQRRKNPKPSRNSSRLNDQRMRKSKAESSPLDSGFIHNSESLQETKVSQKKKPSSQNDTTKKSNLKSISLDSSNEKQSSVYSSKHQSLRDSTFKDRPKRLDQAGIGSNLHISSASELQSDSLTLKKPHENENSKSKNVKRRTSNKMNGGFHLGSSEMFDGPE